MGQQDDEEDEQLEEAGEGTLVQQFRQCVCKCLKVRLAKENILKSFISQNA
jgi:hypothetical protein